MSIDCDYCTEKNIFHNFQCAKLNEKIDRLSQECAVYREALEKLGLYGIGSDFADKVNSIANEALSKGEEIKGGGNADS